MLAQTREERKAEAEKLYQQGTEERRPLEAIAYFKRALEIYREIGDRTSEAWLLHKIGSTYNFARNINEGIKYLEEALELAREISDTSREVFVLNGLGNSYMLGGPVEKSLPYYRESLLLAREIGHESGEAKALGSLGVYYRVTGKYNKALDYLEEARSLLEKLGDQAGVQIAYGQLGLTYRKLGQLEEAKKALEEQLKIAEELDNLGGQRAALGNLGLIYFDLEQYDKASEYHNQQLTLAESLGDQDTKASALANLGMVSEAKGDYEQALNLYRQSEEIRLSLGQDTGYLAGQFGLLYRSMRKHRKALPYLRRYVEATRNNNDRYTHGVALANLAVTLYELRRYKEAEENAIEAIKVRESLSENLKDRDKISINDSFSKTYGLLQLILVKLGQEEIALETAERGRARALVEILLTRLNQQQESPPELIFPDLEEIKKIAKEQNATLVEYSLVPDEQLYIWVISPDGKINFRSVDPPKDTSLQELVRVNRKQIGVRGRSSSNSTSQGNISATHLQQLYQLLIEPIAEFLPQNEEERIIFIPHQELFLVPFPALLDANEIYLIEKHTILTAPSIQALSLTSKQKRGVSSNLPRGEEVLVVGNPLLPQQRIGENSEALKPLPGAEQEAINIAAMLNTTPLIGAQATEPAIVRKMTNAKVIHLATHGLLDDINGVGSPGAIVLASTGNDDGFLTSSEIMEKFGQASATPLQAELVVLSGCDTGSGDIKGEGVIGLSRSLIAAGIPTIVVSLWQVPDDDTNLLMREFYTNLYERKLDKAQAMRQAMLTMLNDDGGNFDPIAWAAFTVIGEAE
ncbi:MAG: CHAT domain-containing protein [Symploca sp. SIO1A3]|nr:CHAT domain-containing protein [Symploca sp. SIO1A3]